MPWKIRVTASAKADINDIKKWNRKQSLIAAKNFAFELFTAIETLQKDNKEHKKVFGNYRRLLLKKFPYVIYYSRQPENQITEIIAVLHNKRDKSLVTKRLKD